MDAVERIARTVLYEGYLLWPYRRSALKNRQRWTFGGVFPQAYSRRRGGDDACVMQTECLIEGDGGTRIDVQVRFLHVVARQVARRVAGGLEPVDELEVGGTRHLSWDEATERAVIASGLTLGRCAPARGGDDGSVHVPVEIPAGCEEEALHDATGATVGALIRRWQLLRGTLDVRTERIGARVFRVSARLANTTPWDGDDRQAALTHAFVSTHTILRARRGAFVSLTDPPAALRPAAEACRNIGTWPVLAGAPGDRQTLLSSPVILPDYPQIAPESPGDLFDGGEIDQLLILNILGMTDDEQEEMRGTDARAREILDRCRSLTPEALMRLHGTVHEMRPMRP